MGYDVPNYISFAIPVFFILISLELWVARKLRLKAYRLNDSLNDLSLGIYSQLIGIFYTGLNIAAFIFLFEKFRVFTIPVDSIGGWIFGFFAVDFCYYWFHRSSHGISIIWGSHEPHHSSEEYNLSVALRQGAFQGMFSIWFYLPLAILGLHPVIFLTHSQFNTLYQFWIHTRAIKKLGFLEYFLNTPSHHRVHHGKNPEYIDKNHAGTLIIWDRFFGTFVEEQQEPVYGTVKPLASWNPAWANVQYWLYLFRMSMKSKGLDKLKIWFAEPGWKPDYLGGKENIPTVNSENFQKYNPEIDQKMKIYVLVQFICGALAAVSVIFMGRSAISVHGILLAGFVLLSLAMIGFILEGRNMLKYELVRIALTLALGIGYGIWASNFPVLALTLSYIAISLGLIAILWYPAKKYFPV